MSCREDRTKISILAEPFMQMYDHLIDSISHDLV